VAADSHTLFRATASEVLQTLLMGHEPGATASHRGHVTRTSVMDQSGRTLPVVPMPEDSAEGWLMVMGLLYGAEPQDMTQKRIRAMLQVAHKHALKHPLEFCCSALKTLCGVSAADAIAAIQMAYDFELEEELQGLFDQLLQASARYELKQHLASGAGATMDRRLLLDILQHALG